MEQWRTTKQSELTSFKTFLRARDSTDGLCSGGSQSGVPGPAASASSDNLLEVQVLGPHPRSPTLQILGAGPVVCVLTGSPVILEHAEA